MAIGLDPKQIVSSDELLMSQVVSQEAIIRLLVEKGIFSKEEFLDMVKVVKLEMAKMVQEAKGGKVKKLIILLSVMVTLLSPISVKAQSTLALQEKCSKAAKEMFYEGYESTMTKSESLGQCVNSYENHYNKKLDKCFILSHSNCFKKDGSSLFVSLWDVFEQKSYAEYSAFRDREGFLTGRICNLGQVRLDGFGEVLKVHGKYQDPVKEKFDSWVKPYMEE